MGAGQKHLIKCRCVLQQFKNKKDPPAHRFVVFSVIEESGDVIPKYAQCPNCGIIHKVVDICKSEILSGKENMKAIVTIEDIKVSLHPNLATILENNKADLPTWEACQYAVESSDWGARVVLTSDTDGEEKTIKIVRVLGETLFKVENFTSLEVVKND